MKQKILFEKTTFMLIIVIIFLGTLLCWFAIRPSVARKTCSNVEMNPYTQEEKNDAKNKFDNNSCSEVMSFEILTSGPVKTSLLGLNTEQARKIFTGLSKDEVRKKIEGIINNRKAMCSSLEKVFNSPDKKWNRQATDEEYVICLRSRGMSLDIPISDNKKLETIQQSINNQSEKIEDLKNKTTSTEDKDSTPDIQEIIKSAQEKADQESKENCQKELAEYNSCLSEYNAKLAEYNSCLSESSDPSSYRYGMGMSCYKPSNYCFKPICAY